MGLFPGDSLFTATVHSVAMFTRESLDLSSCKVDKI